MGFLSDVVGSVGDVFTGVGSALDPVLGGLSSAAKALAPAAPLIAPAAAYFGSQVTNEGNLDVARQYSAASAEQAAINRQFQADMSNTSYQRSVKDLQAAGLNPMMAYSNGGASTPSGAQGVVQQVQMQNAIGSAVDAYNQTAGQTSKSAADYGSANQADANLRLINANADKVVEEIRNVPKEGNRLDAMVAMLFEQKQLMYKQGLNQTDIGNNLRETLLKIKAETGKLISEKELVDFDVDAARNFSNLGRNAKELKPIFDMVRAIFGK